MRGPESTSEEIQAGEAAALRLAEGVPLREALDVGDPRAWLALDLGARVVRHGYRPEFIPAWEAAAPLPARLRLPGAFELLDEARLALVLCHRDGRLRERALGRAAGRPGLLALVVVRTTDWAEPVRHRARELLRAHLDAEAAVALAPLVLLLGRRDRGDFAVDLLGQVLRAAPPERLSPLLAHPDRAVRRFTYRLAVERGALSPVELARAAAEDADTVVQTLCTDAALAGGRTDDDVLALLLAARNPGVRSAGVTALRRAGRPEQAEAFLADRAAMVRACARYVVRQYGGDPAAWYRARCAGPRDEALPPGAVVGLAECGERADAVLLWPLVGHPVPGVRARAVAGLRLLDVAEARRLEPLLEDPAPGVVREVTAALLPSARSLDAGRLTGLLAAERPRHQRVAAFRLLDACGGLVRLRAAVASLDDPDEKLRHWAGQSVQAWTPSADVPAGAAEVGRLLDRARHLFSDHVLKRRKWGAGVRG
ncbi:hypothetical protein [Streptomyces griseosporeus]|uniref:hypothetical protein n=1 Tax=Streptomyces griseosporeus TaxID=1910 RepID=UPI00167CCCC2|nr:hypothetical protein [Streptomyces griseosporeus]GHF90895.1 hypothetical protein GCM10018783_72140 [Streptomyces griseosporeus]